jgi:probable HAF family extracellular repeat protein
MTRTKGTGHCDQGKCIPSRGAAATACLVFAGLALAATGIPAAASAAAATSGLPQQAVHHYRLIDLGTLGGHFSDALGLNQRGDAVGFSTTRHDRRQHAFLWRHGRMIDLGTLGGNSSAATAVNNRDQVVGASDLPNNRTVHAFLWQRGKMTDLGALGGGSSVALAINDRGQVVGVNSRGAGFLWQRGKMADLGVNTANDINNAGEIVGGTMFESGFHAYLLRHRQLVSLVQLPPASSTSEAMFINQRGQILGDVASGGVALAVLWQHQKLITLGTPLGDEPIGLNDRGEVLVFPHLLWQDGQVTDLTTLGVRAADLRGINDRGELAGSIYRHRHKYFRAALWLVNW